VGLASGAVLAGWLVTHRSAVRAFATRAIPVGACVFGVGVLAMGFYNYRNTGDALRSPYMVHTEAYQSVPLFIFRDLKPDKTYNHQVFRDFHESYMLTAYSKKREGFGLAETDFADLFVFFLGYAMAPALLFLPWRRWNHWHSFALAVVVMVILSNKLVATMRLHFHYLAPAVPWMVFLVIAGLRRSRVLRLRGRRVGRAFADGLVAASLLSLLTGCVMHAIYLPRGVAHLSQHRPEVERQLLANDGNDLVIVRYPPNHAPHSEWVYNGADLDGAPIVWARDMGPEKNRQLLNYYSGRRAWVLYPDREPPELVPVDRQ
jgi:hypothetical protein